MRANPRTFNPANEPQIVWSSDDVKVSAIRSTHIPGHASYRVDTPAGSVVIGGDPADDNPRAASPVIYLRAGGDACQGRGHHRAFNDSSHHGPDKDSGFPAYAYYRQSTASDLGAMTQRVAAKRFILTHLVPPPGALAQGISKVPGGPLTEASYRQAALDGRFTGNVVVATDLASVRLRSK